MFAQKRSTNIKRSAFAERGEKIRTTLTVVHTKDPSLTLLITIIFRPPNSCRASFLQRRGGRVFAMVPNSGLVALLLAALFRLGLFWEFFVSKPTQPYLLWESRCGEAPKPNSPLGKRHRHLRLVDRICFGG